MGIIENLKALGNIEKERQAVANKLANSGVLICGIGAYDKPEIQIYNGLEEIAKMIGAEIVEKQRGNHNIIIDNVIEIIVDGVRYFQLSENDGSYLGITHEEVD